MKEGDRYYYTGDMANASDFGVITKITSDKWGTRFWGKLDDGREQKAVTILVFEKGVGQRFKTIEQYNQERAEQFKKMEEILTKKK
jgi:hypothetical protein